MYSGERGRTTVLRHWGGLQKDEERGRPKTTWNELLRERNKAGWKSWNVAKAAARDRECWFENVSALCAYWYRET